MREAVARHFPAETRTSHPQGGYVLGVELPGNIDTADLHVRAIAEGLAFVPGELFSASGIYRNCLRLNCGNPMTPEIEDAVRRLGKLIEQAAQKKVMCATEIWKNSHRVESRTPPLVSTHPRPRRRMGDRAV